MGFIYPPIYSFMDLLLPNPRLEGSREEELCYLCIFSIKQVFLPGNQTILLLL